MITEIFVSNFTPITAMTLTVVWLLKIELTITVHDIGGGTIQETPLARRDYMMVNTKNR